MQLIQCDKCKATEPGTITEPSYGVYGMQGMMGMQQTARSVSVTGWRIVEGSALLCKACSDALNEWLKTRPDEGK